MSRLAVLKSVRALDVQEQEQGQWPLLFQDPIHSLMTGHWIRETWSRWEFKDPSVVRVRSVQGEACCLWMEISPFACAHTGYKQQTTNNVHGGSRLQIWVALNPLITLHSSKRAMYVYVYVYVACLRFVLWAGSRFVSFRFFSAVPCQSEPTRRYQQALIGPTLNKMNWNDAPYVGGRCARSLKRTDRLVDAYAPAQVVCIYTGGRAEVGKNKTNGHLHIVGD